MGVGRLFWESGLKQSIKNHFLRKHVNLVKNLIEVLKTGNFDNFFEPCNFSKKSIFIVLNWNFLLKFFFQYDKMSVEEYYKEKF